MPNYCSNALSLKGPAEGIRALLQECDPAFSFSKFFPVPEGFGDGSDRNLLEDTFDQSPAAVLGVKAPRPTDPQNGYEWRMINWGVKWDVEVDIDEADRLSDELVLHFDTAWRPPIAFCKALSTRFSDVEVELAFAEGGMGYFGVVTYRGGETHTPFRDVRVGADSLTFPFAIAKLPATSGAFWAEKPESMDEDDWEDLEQEERLSPACAKHVDQYGLGLGG